MMQELKRLPWPLIVALSVVALIRPVMSIVGLMDQLGRPITPILATVGITIVWVAVVVLRRVEAPVATLVVTGVLYGVFAVVLSGVLSLALEGELQGPLATPGGFGVVATLAVNALWGTIAGVLARGVRELQHGRG